MEEKDVLAGLEQALRELVAKDSFLLEYNLSERCIASRLAMYLQNAVPEYAVDVEYNRDGRSPKALTLPDECANHRSRNGEPLVVPDVIVHRRGPEGPNILVLELKKTSNPTLRDCDLQRIHAFRSQLNYRYGALIECETREGREPAMWIAQWCAPDRAD